MLRTFIHSVLIGSICSIWAGGLLGCRPESPQQPAVQAARYTLLQSASNWNDSLFLSFGLGINVYASYLFVPEPSNKRLVQFDTSLNYLRQWGREGRGPGEFLLPFQTIVLKDTVFTFDTSNRKITYHTLNGSFLGEVKIPADIEAGITGRMAVDKDFNLYMSTPRAATAIVKFDLSGKVLARFGASRQNYLSTRHLFWTEQNLLLSIGCVEPRIELYESSGELIASFSFEGLPEIVQAMKDVKHLYASNGYSWANMLYSIFYDASYSAGKLYVLYRHHPDFAESPGIMIGNHLLVFNLFPSINLEQKVALEPPDSRRFYLSISVDSAGEKLYAFENTEKELCVFGIPHP